MADTLGFDSARIKRLRNPERLEYFQPERIWEVLQPKPDCTLIDIGAGVGFLTIPFAEKFPAAKVFGCDILEGMVGLLHQDAEQRGLDNLEALLMAPNLVSLDNDVADIIIMGQVHHELDAPESLLRECRRLLKRQGSIAIVDWADEENGKSPPTGRRVPAARIRHELQDAGFRNIETHAVYKYHTFITGIA
ncbi:MAG: class I SAM-dependent methyltransferase [Pseudomonadota bacterium]|nr:class I SAM-dependent methyltransferase [Pseudomonadota bacterium]